MNPQHRGRDGRMIDNELDARRLRKEKRDRTVDVVLFLCLLSAMLVWALS